MTRALFIAGCGTGVGKTYIAAALARALAQSGAPVRVLKPVESGVDDAAPEATDAGALLAAINIDPTPGAAAAISPWRYPAPLAPNIAARRAGGALGLDEILDFVRSEIETAPGPVLIEGAGGIMSPLTDAATCLDLVAELGAPALLVGGAYLGAISHFLTAAEAMRARGAVCAGLVVSEAEPGPMPLAELRGEIARFTDLPICLAEKGGEAGADLLAFTRRLNLIP